MQDGRPRRGRRLGDDESRLPRQPARGRPFTKDLGYGKGLILTLVYVRMAIRFGHTQRIPLLFCGKIDLLDLPTLHLLEDEGLVTSPSFVPPPFNDLPSLATTLSLGRFTGQLDLERMSADYQRILS